MIGQDSSSVLCFDILSGLPKQEDLRALLVKQVLGCIRIKNVVSTSNAKKLVFNAMKKGRIHDRLEGLMIAGNTYYQSAQGGKISDRYFENSDSFATWIRKISNGLSILDSVIGIFSSMHHLGISPAALDDGRLMPPAIFRIYPADKNVEILPHQDILHWYINSNIAKSLDGQAGWNIYLDIPSKGGELLIYDNKLNEKDYNSLANGNYGIPWEVAGEPLLRIVPDIGELILIDSQRLHAIKACSGQGYRVTLSGFLGYSENKSLICWA
jgi:hypothetical protein